MTVLRRKPTAYGVTGQESKQVKSFNSKLRYTQGARISLNGTGATTTATISLNSPGRELLGITVTPVSGLLTTLADTQVTLIVNNNNIVLDISANNTNPNFVGNMIFFPTPQPLSGNDSIKLNVTKNDAGAAFAIINVFYVPQ